MVAWRWHSSPCFFKRGATGAEVPFHYRFRSRQIFGVANDFYLNFPKLPRNDYYAIFDYKFSPTKIMTTFFGVTSKKRHVFFCKPWAPFFEVKQRSAPFLRGFSGMLPSFQQIKTFGGALALCRPNTFRQVCDSAIKMRRGRLGSRGAFH